MITTNAVRWIEPSMIDTAAAVLLSRHSLEALGALTGVLGVSIALYLQLISNRQVKPRYVVGFYLLGTGLLLLHLRPLPAFGPTASAVGRLLGLTIILAGELAAFHHVYRVSDVQTPREVAEDVAAHLDRR